MAISTLHYILLGLLKLEQPLSGYDLKNLIDESTGHFWYSDYSQVYRALNDLESEGWVEGERDDQNQRNRRPYRITADGENAFQAWLQSELEVPPARNPYLARIFFGQHIPPETLRAQVMALRGYYAGLNQAYSAIAPQITAENQDTYPDDLPYWLLTLDLGKRISQAHIEWCDAILAHLDQSKPQEMDS